MISNLFNLILLHVENIYFWNFWNVNLFPQILAFVYYLNLGGVKIIPNKRALMKMYPHFYLCAQIDLFTVSFILVGIFFFSPNAQSLSVCYSVGANLLFRIYTYTLSPCQQPPDVVTRKV